MLSYEFLSNHQVRKYLPDELNGTKPSQVPQGKFLIMDQLKNWVYCVRLSLLLYTGYSASIHYWLYNNVD